MGRADLGRGSELWHCALQGKFTSRGRAKRAYHFDSWRLNTLGTWWMPAYVYTEEVEPYDPSHKLWFKAQTRVWGYDLRNAGDPQENAKQTAPLEYVTEDTAFPPENTIVKRLQVAGLMVGDSRSCCMEVLATTSGAVTWPGRKRGAALTSL